MKKPTVRLSCGHEIPESEILSAAAAINGRRGGRLQTPHAGPGRPRSEDRCACGAMTVKRAEARSHKCG